MTQLKAIKTNSSYYYKCRCGYEFEESLGKYGCANCGGCYTAKLTERLMIKLWLAGSKINGEAVYYLRRRNVTYFKKGDIRISIHNPELSMTLKGCPYGTIVLISDEPYQ